MLKKLSDFNAKRLKGKREGAFTVIRKDRTENLQTEAATVPEKLYFPLTMHIGAPAKAVVNIGDKVKIGTLIAEKTGFISASVHSSVSGEVIDIANHPTSNGEGPCIIIKNDFNDTVEEPLYALDKELSVKEMIEVIEKAGIVGMGGAAFPTSVKFAPQNPDKIDTILINGAECEPYSTSDHRLMVEYGEELIKGIKILLKLVPAKKVMIGLEDDMHEAIEVLEKLTANEDQIDVHALITKYPQGSEKNLIKNLLGREVPPGKLPADVGTIVTNVGTTVAIYEAITFGRPLTKRIVTVSGEAIKNPKNLMVRIGTPMESLLNDCDGFQMDPGKMIHGGPMMGKALNSGRIPVVKGTTSLAFLNKEDAKEDERTPCIRCSECLNVCPVSLQPIMISNAYEDNDIERAEKLGAMDCIECGACSYICPSKIPILENIRKARTVIRAREEVK